MFTKTNTTRAIGDAHAAKTTTRLMQRLLHILERPPALIMREWKRVARASPVGTRTRGALDANRDRSPFAHLPLPIAGWPNGRAFDVNHRPRFWDGRPVRGAAVQAACAGGTPAP